MASEIGRGQTKGRNTFGVLDSEKHAAREQNDVGKSIGEGENPVREAQSSRLDPKYHRTRETRWENGGTTLQA